MEDIISQPTRLPLGSVVGHEVADGAVHGGLVRYSYRHVRFLPSTALVYGRPAPSHPSQTRTSTLRGFIGGDLRLRGSLD